MKSIIRIGTIAAFLIAGASPAVAHHSHASLNPEDVRLYKGRVVKYSWTMPHVFLRIDAPDEDGAIVEYTVELQHPPAMARLGWSKETWKPGDRITWEGPHDRDLDDDALPARLVRDGAEALRDAHLAVLDDHAAAGQHRDRQQQPHAHA